MDKAIFGSAAQPRYPRARENLHQFLREGTAQVSAVQHDARYTLAIQEPCKAADRCLYFGKFWHGSGL
jgi:hypothetical protein